MEGEIEKFEIAQKLWEMVVKDLVSMLQLSKTDIKEHFKMFYLKFTLYFKNKHNQIISLI